MEMEMELIEMEVFGATVHTPWRGVIILKEKAGDDYLVIYTERWFVERFVEILKQKLKGFVFPRPLSHDLLKNIIGELGAEIKYFVITEVKDGTFFGDLVLQTSEKELRINCCPSDGIVLSFIAGTPIYVTENVIENYGYKKDPVSGLLKPRYVSGADKDKSEISEIDEKLKKTPFGEFIQELNLDNL